MTAIDAYLGAAGQAVALLRKPEVAAAWEQPSALAEATAGGVTDHHAYQIFSVRSALEGPASDEAPIPLLEHYAHAVWIGAPLGGRASWHPGGVSRPRERSRCGGAPTPRSLSSRRNCRAFRRPGCVPTADRLGAESRRFSHHADDGTRRAHGRSRGQRRARHTGTPGRRVRPGARAAGPTRRPAARPGALLRALA